MNQNLKVPSTVPGFRWTYICHAQWYQVLVYVRSIV